MPRLPASSHTFALRHADIPPAGPPQHAATPAPFGARLHTAPAPAACCLTCAATFLAYRVVQFARAAALVQRYRISIAAVTCLATTRHSAAVNTWLPVCYHRHSTCYLPHAPLYGTTATYTCDAISAARSPRHLPAVSSRLPHVNQQPSAAHCGLAPLRDIFGRTVEPAPPHRARRLCLLWTPRV